MKSTQLIAAALVGSTTHTLTDEAARHAVMRRVDIPTRDLPEPEPVPQQEPHPTSAEFTRVLEAILALPRETQDPLLIETLGLLVDADLVLPPRHLLSLLTLARSNHELAEALRPVLGARGRLLVDLDLAWLRNQVTRTPKPRDWQEGTLIQRVAWIRHLRTTDPAAARELVAATHKEKAEDRAELIAALDVGLGPADEEFLESLLSEHSTQIRHAAAELLHGLEGSAHLDRAIRLAATCFAGASPRRKGLLGRITAPTQEEIGKLCPESVDTSVNAHAGRRVQTLVGIIPPRRWGELRLGVADLVAGVSLDDEPLSLLDALATATLRWGDTEAARILVPHCPDPDPDLVLLLPPDERDAVIADLATRTGPVSFEQMCTRFRAHPGLRLTEGTARAVLDHFIRAVNDQGQLPTDLCWFLAFCSDPHHSDDLVAGLTEIIRDPEFPDAGRVPARHATTALSLRHAIHRSIEESR